MPAAYELMSNKRPIDESSSDGQVKKKMPLFIPNLKTKKDNKHSLDAAYIQVNKRVKVDKAIESSSKDESFHSSELFLIPGSGNPEIQISPSLLEYIQRSQESQFMKNPLDLCGMQTNQMQLVLFKPNVYEVSVNEEKAEFEEKEQNSSDPMEIDWLFLAPYIELESMDQFTWKLADFIREILEFFFLCVNTHTSGSNIDQ